MMFGFRVSAGYLDAVANEFMCNEWERKGCIWMFISMLSTIWDQRQMSFILL